MKQGKWFSYNYVVILRCMLWFRDVIRNSPQSGEPRHPRHISRDGSHVRYGDVLLRIIIDPVISGVYPGYLAVNTSALLTNNAWYRRDAFWGSWTTYFGTHQMRYTLEIDRVWPIRGGGVLVCLLCDGHGERGVGGQTPQC